VAERLAETKAMRERGQITLPTTVAQERETNPFVRSTNVEEFARRRSAKDSFR
jgi:hydroxyacylglutathione hydrolase